MSAATADRVPVIAVTGHLGAGKTSLLNHLLRTPGARIGVVINDFGELNVDAALVTGQVDEAASIAGGCICCLSDAGGLDAALEQLAQPRLQLDAILVEASGIADPTTLSRLIRYSGAERVRSGGVIEVIDAVEHFDTVDTRPEPPARYRAANLVVIGKTDLLAEPERAAVVDRIRDRVGSRNPIAQFAIARNGRIDPALVFDTAADEDPDDQLPIARLLREQRGEHDATHEHDEHEHGHRHHEHAAAVSVALPEAVNPTALVDLLEDPPAGAYRMKGRVRVRGARGERGYLVNVVGHSIHVAPLAEAPTVGELVAIGLQLDTAAAKPRLDAVAHTPAEKADAQGLRRLQRYRRLSE